VVSLGVLLVILGVGSLVLPSLGLQFAVMEPIDAYQPWIGVIVAALGLITILFAQRRQATQQSTTVVNETTAPPAEQ